MVQPTRLKICGIRRLEDIELVNEVKPEVIGFVFAPHSSRFVTFEQAAEMKKVLSPQIKSVGVFVNADIEEIVSLFEAGVINLVQLHGGESLSYVQELKARIPAEIIYALSPEQLFCEVEDSERITQNEHKLDVKSETLAAAEMTDYLLFDSRQAGSGVSFDWSLIPTSDKPVFLAGGISEKNLSEALKLGFYALDLSSSLETEGYKDASKVKSFVQAFYKEQAMNEKVVGHKLTQVDAIDEAFFGSFGGQYIPETLMNAIEDLRLAYQFYKDDPAFQSELKDLLDNYAGRPSSLYYAKNLSESLGGAKIYLKREDLNHTGSHKINNVLGQSLLAKRMGKKRIIAETGAGQHGVAAATAAALLGLECDVFMGKEDTIRQALNVYRMELLGATVHPVSSGTMTLKDAVNEAMREWSLCVEDSFYVLGSVMGPHPYPTMVRDFQAVIGRELKEQLHKVEGKLPDAVVACVGGGSNAIGSFFDFIEDESVKLIGCEAAGLGIDTDQHAATLSKGSIGVLHGMKSLFCQDEFGQITPVYSISAGLDYPGIGPEHAHLHEIGRAQYVPVTDEEAIAAFEKLSRTEGIIPAIESAHALHYACELAARMRPDQIVAVCLSGRGDKDVAAIARYKGSDLHE